MNRHLLDSISGPGDIKKIPVDQLPALAGQIRSLILESVSRTGGHLASSLGAVEIIIALHYCLRLPQDKIVFDVGHQAYAHKILTGRKDGFSALRQWGGISGFPSKDESEFDTAMSGHSSTAVSVALGHACARDLGGGAPGNKIVAVIGDGSLSGGLCFEGLNNAGHLKKDMLVVLNTNELSIAPNVGALSTYLNKLISAPIYNRFRENFDRFLEARGTRGKRLKRIAGRFEENLKGFFIPGILFEELGFRYFGPFDGHDLSVLVPRLRNILEFKGPKLLHVITRKGKGYGPAEKEPVRFHSVGAFDLSTGEAASSGAGSTYTDVFGKTLVDLGNRDSRVCAITAAMPEGTGLDMFRDAFPGRFFDVGIAEEHAICFAGGLASAGLRPVVAVYSTFFQRAVDQLIEDVALQNLPVVICLDRAGIVGEDGVTHQGIFDISVARSVPNVTVMAPKDGLELMKMLEFSLTLPGPSVIRYPKAVCPESSLPCVGVEAGVPELIRKGADATVFALGSMVLPSLSAAELLQKEGISCQVVNCRFVKPLDKQALSKVSLKGVVFTVEEGVVQGGFGSAVCEALEQKVVRIGLPDQFIPHGKRSFLLERYGLTPAGIAGRILSVLKNG